MTSKWATILSCSSKISVKSVSLKVINCLILNTNAGLQIKLMALASNENWQSKILTLKYAPAVGHNFIIESVHILGQSMTV